MKLLLLSVFLFVSVPAWSQSSIEFVETPSTAGYVVLRDLFQVLQKMKEEAAWEHLDNQVRVTGHESQSTNCYAPAIRILFSQYQTQDQDIDTITFVCGHKPWNFIFARPIGALATKFEDYFAVRWLENLKKLPEYRIELDLGNFSLTRRKNGEWDIFTFQQEDFGRSFEVEIAEIDGPKMRRNQTTYKEGGMRQLSLGLVEEKNDSQIPQLKFFGHLGGVELSMPTYRERYLRIRLYLSTLISSYMF